MRIAVDARELCGTPTGVGRYLFELLREWSSGPELGRHTWTLYAHETPHVPPPMAPAVRVLPGTGGTLWEQRDLARRLRHETPDVLFAPAYTAPLAVSCPTVLTIHDVSYFARPEWFGWREGMRRRRLTTWAARRARAIVTVSEFSRGEIVRHVGIPADLVHVVPHGIRVPPTPAAPRAPLVLYVGSIFERRHVDVLIEAFAKVVATRVPAARLTLVGANRLPIPGALDAWLSSVPEDVRARIAVRSWIEDPALDTLYSEASVFAFLSDYEGFGLTPLEAAARGVPPVVLDTPVAREVYGPSALYVSAPPRPEALGDVLATLLTVPGQRQALIDEAPAVLSRYRWDEAARRTLDILRTAAHA